MKLPAPYLTARRALMAATSVAAAKKVRNQSMALEVYAFQAKDSELMGLSIDIKKRAERRIGELMAAARDAGKLKRGGDRAKVFEKPLLDQGIDKNLADRARKAAALTDEAFEQAVARAKALAIAAVEGAGQVLRAARAERHAVKTARRHDRERELGDKLTALPAKRYGVILADPEWQFGVWSERGQDRAAANHYPTSALELIKARPVGEIAALDCVLFLWATVPMLPEALDVLAAWGFRYVSQIIWLKDRIGTGYWARNKHEILLIGSRGNIPAPAPGEQPESVIAAPVGRHSEKPAVFYELIERLFPTLPKIELNARAARVGWDNWGLEAPGEVA